jgi:thiamine biosynthesis lipoprotein
MGTSLQVSVSAPYRPLGIAAIEAAFSAVRPPTTCSAPGVMTASWPGSTAPLRAWQSPVPALDRMLRAVERCRQGTGDAFDPAIGALVEAWDLRGRGRLPSARELGAARARSGLGHFRFAPGPAVVRDTDGVWIDSGGFGKGAALAAARDSLLAHGIASALLNFGGQVLVLGPDERGGDWAVPVAHPSPGERAAHSAARPSASTSCIGALRPGGERRLGHVLPDRTAGGTVGQCHRGGDRCSRTCSPQCSVPTRPRLGPRPPRPGCAGAGRAGGPAASRWTAGLEPFLVLDSTLVRGG